MTLVISLSASRVFLGEDTLCGSRISLGADISHCASRVFLGVDIVHLPVLTNIIIFIEISSTKG
jgi:hypothetical protein